MNDLNFKLTIYIDSFVSGNYDKDKIQYIEKPNSVMEHFNLRFNVVFVFWKVKLFQRLRVV